jgi:hypothetical protein
MFQKKGSITRKRISLKISQKPQTLCQLQATRGVKDLCTQENNLKTYSIEFVNIDFEALNRDLTLGNAAFKLAHTIQLINRPKTSSE